MAKPTKGGRTTPSKRARSQRDQDADAPTPDPSGRYTPKTPTYRLRPGWHRVVGWIGVALGIGIAAVNDVMLMGEDLTLLPGGHNELYLFLGMAIGGSSTWFLGLFDRGTTVYG